MALWPTEPFDPTLQHDTWMDVPCQVCGDLAVCQACQTCADCCPCLSEGIALLRLADMYMSKLPA